MAKVGDIEVKLRLDEKDLKRVIFYHRLSLFSLVLSSVAVAMSLWGMFNG